MYMSEHTISLGAHGYSEVESDWLCPEYSQMFLILPADFADKNAIVLVTVEMAHLPSL